ncbi:tRNA (adenosine(37)-N6)-threonylcarbamoyltransferase complex dimerization subunit type 1 TsaB [Listeria costaricensis]|uniref:tRNA (adenosine(37)-N6)-threonylcarbamoyltransferase complex dimerization subunit type 1 TsaB n=1 Tax=Listeria costaricensis TaxID=2026604 RepID=UPI000C06A6D5|nr:tRNA (adenosine(37)-N6)-threonylcarbamoyltransferase complex dimerization subunit type 1 TsaB [Listeria costaricensis]
MILGIDTSTDTMSIALYQEGTILGEYTTNLKKNHSVRLLPAIQTLLEECGATPRDLTKIAVSEGPGSYTGLRIGVTAAKTLAWDLDIPLVGISSLEVLAASGRYFNGKIVPLMDARRGNVYAGVYETAASGLASVHADQHISLEELLAYLEEKKQPVLFIGQLSAAFREQIIAALGERATLSEPPYAYARAGTLTWLAEQKAGVPVHTFVPTYLKLAEAESKWLEARKES